MPLLQVADPEAGLTEDDKQILASALTFAEKQASTRALATLRPRLGNPCPPPLPSGAEETY